MKGGKKEFPWLHSIMLVSPCKMPLGQLKQTTPLELVAPSYICNFYYYCKFHTCWRRIATELYRVHKHTLKHSFLYTYLWEYFCIHTHTHIQCLQYGPGLNLVLVLNKIWHVLITIQPRQSIWSHIGDKVLGLKYIYLYSRVIVYSNTFLQVNQYGWD